MNYFYLFLLSTEIVVHRHICFPTYVIHGIYPSYICSLCDMYIHCKESDLQ